MSDKPQNTPPVNPEIEARLKAIADEERALLGDEADEPATPPQARPPAAPVIPGADIVPAAKPLDITPPPPPNPSEAPKPDEKDSLIAQLKTELDSAKAERADIVKKLNDADGARGTRIKQLQDALEASQKAIEELRAKITAAPPAPESGKPGSAAPGSALFDTLCKDYSKEFRESPEVAGLFDIAEKICASVEGKFATMQQQVAALTQQLTGATAEVKKVQEVATSAASNSEVDRWNNAVERLAPGFMVANGVVNGTPDPKWLAFLDAPINPLDKKHTWRAMLEREGYEVAQVASVFEMFTKQQGGGTEIPAPGATADGRPTLADQAAPAKAGSSAPPANGGSGKRLYTRAEYDAMEIAIARTANVTPEMKATWNDMLVAEVEGRIK